MPKLVKNIENRKSKRSVRDEAYLRLRTAIVSGDLPASFPIREVEMSKRLKISRTPLREALFQLEREGFVDSQFGTGFKVAPLSVREAEELFMLLALLESFAVENSREFSSSEIEQLQTLHQKICDSQGPEHRIKFDAELHRCFTAGCSNSELHKSLNDLRDKCFRYEWLYGTSETKDRSCREHEQIIEAITAGEQKRAARLIRRHTVDSIPRLVKIISQHQSNSLVGSK